MEALKRAIRSEYKKLNTVETYQKFLSIQAKQAKAFENSETVIRDLMTQTEFFKEKE